MPHEANRANNAAFADRFASGMATASDRRFAIMVAFGRLGVIREANSGSSDYYTIRRSPTEVFRVRVSDHDAHEVNEERFGGTHIEIDIGGHQRELVSHRAKRLSLSAIDDLIKSIVDRYGGPSERGSPP